MSDRAKLLQDLSVAWLLKCLETGTRPVLNPLTGKIEQLPISSAEIKEARAWRADLIKQDPDSEMADKLKKASESLDEPVRAAPAQAAADTADETFP